MYSNKLYFEATALLYTLSVIMVLIVIAGMLACVTLWMKGKEPSLHHSLNIPAIIKSFICDVLLQLQILKISFIRWLMHFCIFIGFMGLLAETSLMAFMSHFLPPDNFLSKTFFDYQDGVGAHILDVWGDVFGVMLLLGLTIAIIRRFIIPAKQLETLSKDTMSLLLLLVIALTGFFCEGVRLMYPEYASVATYSFAGNILTKMLEGIGLGLIDYKLWVWIHAIISMIFLAYIPFSKAWHIFVSPLEIVIDASERA